MLSCWAHEEGCDNKLLVLMHQYFTTKTGVNWF